MLQCNNAVTGLKVPQGAGGKRHLTSHGSPFVTTLEAAAPHRIPSADPRRLIAVASLAILLSELVFLAGAYVQGFFITDAAGLSTGKYRKPQSATPSTASIAGITRHRSCSRRRSARCSRSCRPASPG
jgi:hypothetical protein